MRFLTREEMHELGARVIAAREAGMMMKQAPYEFGYPLWSIKKAVRAVSSDPERMRAMFATGHNTAQIAKRLHVSEAFVYNTLARARA